MNKSERERLAWMVTEMTTSFDSTPEVVVWGEKLLAEFPNISKEIELYKDTHKIHNVTDSYLKYIVDMSSSGSSLTENDKKVLMIGVSGRKELYHVFDEYFCHDAAIELDEVEDAIGRDKTVAKEVVKRLLSDSYLIETIDSSSVLTDEQKDLFTGRYLLEGYL
ncbi:hypothetical protein [Alteromonas macleodii]|uniref:hypothetical protein n=1 Tax=Alteromonas macleodii TaxID=28108 RepID=UPI0031401F48